MTTSEPFPPAPDLRFGSFTVLDALQLGLIDCPADADIRTVARTMAAHGVHCVVVRGSDPDGWGIVSDRDLMAALGSQPAGATAGQLAATDPLVVDPIDTLEHTAQLMVEHQTTHAVVVDPVTSRPIGILSTLDVARCLAG